MKITIIKSVEDAHLATGLAVVIDVFRAFSVQAYLFENGVEAIIPVQTLDEAYALKEKNPDYVLIGERGGVKPEGFDYGNSPTEILNVNFSHKTVIHTTSNGTKGLLNAVNADLTLTGSFLVADSIISFIQKNHIETISLVSTSPDSEADNEDLLLAYYLRDKLEGVKVNESDLIEIMNKTSTYAFLFKEVGVPETDFKLCLDFNRCSFVIKKIIKDGQLSLIKVVT